MTDPAKIRAEGRRLLAAIATSVDYEDAAVRFVGYMLDNPALLADPAPVGLTADERGLMEFWRNQDEACADDLLAIIDRLSAPTEEGTNG